VRAAFDAQEVASESPKLVVLFKEDRSFHANP
jgi:hypothetical protein